MNLIARQLQVTFASATFALAVNPRRTEFISSAPCRRRHQLSAGTCRYFSARVRRIAAASSDI